MNKCILIGNLGKDPELRKTQDGRPVSSLSIATSEKFKDKTHTEWHRVVLFGKLAENTAKYLRKGSKVMVEGRIHSRQWEDNGTKKFATEIVASNVEFLDSQGNRETQAEEDYFS